MLRAVNRLHDHLGGRVEGRIRLGDLDVYGPGTRAELVRSRVGMVFQRPNPFPTMSIFDNVVSGLRFAGIRKKSLLKEAAELALRQAALWDLVEHRLHQPAVAAVGGPATTPVHRPGTGRTARGAPYGRALLGA